MPVWSYSARTVGGDLKRAEYEATSREEVIAHLRSQRLRHNRVVAQLGEQRVQQRPEIVVKLGQEPGPALEDPAPW